jgi:hypothetical protein
MAMVLAMEDLPVPAIPWRTKIVLRCSSPAEIESDASHWEFGTPYQE